MIRRHCQSSSILWGLQPFHEQVYVIWPVVKIVKRIRVIQTVQIVDEFPIIVWIKEFWGDFNVIEWAGVLKPINEFVKILVKPCFRSVVLLGIKGVLS